MKTSPLIEASSLEESVLNTDTRSISNVRLIRAGMSLNRRKYSMEVLAKAAPLFEGTKAYANHPDWFDSGRSVRDITGWFTEVRVGNDGLYATRHFTRNHAGNDSFEMASDILTGRAPESLYGLSINAVGKTTKAKGDEGDFELVDEIVSVYSVDDVTTPAAGGSLLVAGEDDSFARRFLKNITLEDLEELRPDMIVAFKKKWQAVRQDEALRAAVDEAAQSKKTAEELTKNVDNLQRELARFNLVASAERVVALAKLPPIFAEDLKRRLEQVTPSEWSALVKTETDKASTVRSAPQLPLEVELRTRSQAPAPAVTYETVETPEQHAAYLRRIKEK